MKPALFFERVREEFLDHLDEEIEMYAMEPLEDQESADESSIDRNEFRRRYFRELHQLQIELVKLQDWVVAEGKRDMRPVARSLQVALTRSLCSSNHQTTNVPCKVHEDRTELSSESPRY